MFTTTYEQIGYNGITRVYWDGELCATATVNHKLKTTNISYNKGPGEPAELDSMEYKFFADYEDLAATMINCLREEGAPTIYR
jgi:hypothetical protein